MIIAPVISWTTTTARAWAWTTASGTAARQNNVQQTAACYKYGQWIGLCRKAKKEGAAGQIASGFVELQICLHSSRGCIQNNKYSFIHALASPVIHKIFAIIILR